MSEQKFLEGVTFFDVIGPTCCIGVIGFQGGLLDCMGNPADSPLEELFAVGDRSEASCRAFCAARGWRLESKELQTSGITYTLSTGEVL
jgi:hypothetical protein